MILTKKRRLRLEIRQQTALIPRGERLRQAVEVFSRLESTEVFKKARNIGFFWSLSDEIPTQEIMEQWSGVKNLYLPVTRGEDMSFVQYTAGCRMEEGDLRLLVPVGTKGIDPDKLDIIVTPGVAFDTCGRRLGKGKGYYDRFFEKTAAYRIGVCMEHQLIGEIPAEPHDKTVDMVITPTGMFVTVKDDSEKPVAKKAMKPSSENPLFGNLS